MSTTRFARTLLLVQLFASVLIAGDPWAIGPSHDLLAQTCVFTHGYWKTHAGTWPRQSLVLGDPTFSGHTYQKNELLPLLDASTKGDASLVLATQLIAAKLNVANGSNPQPIADALIRADQLLGAFRRRLPYGVKSNSQIGADMTSIAATLERYNTGQIPGSCGVSNRAPVARAGSDQTVALGALVTLDGSASSDADGDPLTFDWAFVSKPAGSTAVLANPTAVTPSFAADRSGTYAVRLIVRDAVSQSVADTVNVSTQNSAPVANAGPDATGINGETITLNGGGSTDADGDPLTYHWTFVIKPAGSIAALLNDSAVTPTFVIDVSGDYVVQLITNDGFVNSLADTVTVTTINSRPIANAGPNQSALVGALVQLDGSGSTDVDGDPLTYEWSLTTAPAGSIVTLSNASAVQPTLTPDLTGTYIAQLVVRDPTSASDPDTISVVVDVAPPTNQAPTAEAGSPQTIALGTTVQLDGGASSDPDGDVLIYKWSLSTPAGSGAALSDPTASSPTFVADLSGTYVAQLIVNDGTIDSAPDTVSISTENSGPVAKAGEDQAVATGVTVTLDGSASFDPDGAALQYTWSLISRPVTSAAAVSNATIVNPTFVADVEGTYVAQLIVGDGVLLSSPDTVTITAALGADLRVTFYRAADKPAVGTTVEWGIQIFNAGPAVATAARVHAPLPAGYTFLSASMSAGTSYDAATGMWTIGPPATTNGSSIGITYRVNQTGPYDLVASIVESDRPDPNPANDTLTQVVTPDGSADLALSVFAAADTPPIGSTQTWGIQVHNLGPAVATVARIHAPLPAGYTFLSANMTAGTSYDAATGIWTISPPAPTNGSSIGITYRVNPTGPYDLVAAIVESDAPDPNPANNARTIIVTPNRNADLSVAFLRFFQTDNVPPGSSFAMLVDVSNLGPADAADVTAQFQLPAGYTVTNVSLQVTAGTTYDSGTGIWTIGAMRAFTLARLVVQVTVNATGPIDVRVAITNSSAPDPNLANNAVTPQRINRPPVANAGGDQSASTHAAVNLDGTASFDADGDPITFVWSYALRPINSAAALTSATTPTPSFTPDLSGNYVAQLVVRDSFGLSSVADTSTVSAIVTNSPPAIVTGPVTVAAVTQPYQYDVNATDPDGANGLTFSLTTAPAGMSIDPGTGVIAWIPAANQSGQQPVAVRVQDAGGLFATQSFAVQVSSPGNDQPAALDDAYEVRVSESLSVSAPGILGNDTDETPLAARLVSSPGNGTVLLNQDGSFTYTPHAMNPGELVLAENVNLAARIPGVTVFRAASSCPRCAIDENLTTKFESLGGPIEIVFPAAVTVSQVKIVASRIPGDPKISAGIFELLDANGVELYDSGPVEIPGPIFDATLNMPNLQGVRRVRFTPTASPTSLFFSTLAELKVIGSALIQREPFVEPNLVQLLPASVEASSFISHNTPESLIDDNPGTTWYSNGNVGDFIEVTFPLDVTVTQLRSSNPNGRPDGFGSSNPIQCSGTFTLLDRTRNVLFDSGVVNEPSGFVNPSDFFTLDVPNVVDVRYVRYTVASCIGSFPAGFAELRVIGSAAVTTPSFGLGEKFQALAGREAHSTPIVVNLTDDNGDGLINANDIPDIVVPVEAIGDQLKGEIIAISGADGQELFTAGGPNLVSPWSELAAADIDGDGTPEIIAVHSDGSHLIAFEHTGILKWVSDANAMPSFNLGSVVYTGAISIANLDGAGAPEIIVGASVFDADGHLLGDGRALNGTTGGIGLRSAISAVGDIDLDGQPELVAGPTTYRLTGGQLTKVWQRADRADGYVAIANLDDDPQAEIVSVANGVVYALNHDGSDYQGWNAPTHAPVPIPGGGQGGAPLIVDVDGDGLPEIGVAAASHFVLFNRDGSIRWMSAISDRSSNSTGAVAFDLNGDGEVEIIYRDEFFLRIYRGADGVLLAKTVVGSATWAEEPVVADVDNDGHADIVVSSDFFAQSQGDTGIIVFQDVANKWKRTRRIWNQHSYHVTNVNEDATIPLNESAHWLVPGLNNFRTNAFVPGESQDETDRFTYVASDGVLESNAATVHIAIRTPNAGPRITSTPLTAAADGVFYAYAAQASDPDAGDILTFSLPSAPAGMSIDPASGLIEWVPTAGQQGLHDVVVKVADVRGLYALQGYQITVAAALIVPDVVGQLQAAAESAITSASLAIGAVTTRHSAGTPQGAVISQNPAAGSSAATGTPVSFVVSLGPPPVGTVPNVVGLVQTTAQQDVTAAGFNNTVSGQNNSLVPVGVVMSQNPAGGTVAPASTVVNLVVSLGPPPGDLDLDLDGFTGNHGDCNDTNDAINPNAFDPPGDGIDQNCNGVDSIVGDNIFPNASIESPAEDAEITMPTDIVGTATDANFLRYRLLVAGVDEETFVEIALGTIPVTSGVLGRLDPTLRENGMYRVQLVVEDVNGQIAIDERVYRVTGEAKVGILGLSFVDLRVPVSGIPITVIRNYDSRVRSRRDFGIGWELQVKTGRYQNNRRPGEGWRVETAPGPFGLPCTVTTETRSHFTELRLSDRESYLFRPRLTGLAAVVGGCVGSVVFDFVDGNLPGATLTVLGNSDIIYTSGDQLTEFDGSLDTGQLFDPREVRLTTVDGRIVDFRQASGITRIEDNNANTLRITTAGIVHSSGKNIAFTRDARGRITRITDPNAKTVTYSYADEDLSESVDQLGNRTTYVYDAQHRLLEIHDPLGNRAMQAEYDADGRLIAMIDAKGRRIEFSHDLNGREEIITDSRGNATRAVYDARGFVQSRESAVTIDGVQTLATSTFVHDSLGNALSQIDADGRRTDAVYDGQDLTQEVVDPSGLQVRSTITLDARREPLTITDPSGNTLSFAYDGRGNLKVFSDPLGHAMAISYDSSGRPTGAADALGIRRVGSHDAAGNLLSEETIDATGVVLQRQSYTYDATGNRLTATQFKAVNGTSRALTTAYLYDARNRVVAVTDPLGNTIRTRYNALGLIEATIDALGRQTRHTYDEVGARVRTDHPDGTSETFEYDEVGNVIVETDRAGGTTHHVYDELNREIRSTSSGGKTAETVYSPGGRTMAVVDALGNRTAFSYDAAGRRTRTTQPEVFNAAQGGLARPETREEYDLNGRLTAVIDPNGNRTAFQWESTDRIIRRDYADGTSVSSTFDALGRLIGRIDEAGRVTGFEYDGLGRLKRVIEPPPSAQQTSPITTYAWDESGNLLSSTDALGHVTTYRYDDLNRPIERILPRGGSERFAYDAVGNLISHIDFNGSTNTFQYDAMNRLVRKNLADGSVVTVTYTAMGQRASMVDSRGTTTYQYDLDNRLAQIIHPTGAIVRYAYDARGRLQSVASPGGTLTYAYDAIGRLTQVLGPSGATQYGLDLAGNVIGITGANGVATQQSFDARNRLTTIRHALGATTIGSFTYQLSPTGRRLSMAEADGSLESYSYDSLDRLVNETRTGTAPRFINYTYDAKGNRTSMLRNATPLFYTYDADDRLATAGGTSFTYDENGNLLTQSVGGAITGYEWDPENRLVRAAGAAGTTAYGYDGDGNRVSRTAAGVTTRFLVDENITGLSQTLEERSALGGLIAHHTYGKGRVSTTDGTATSFLHRDALGSTRLLTNVSGAVSDTYGYESFGNLATTTGSTDNPYLFAGERFDPSLGLYDLRARNYAPATGLFLGRDPEWGVTGDPRSAHPFLYAHADPVNVTDPTGRFSLIEFATVDAMQNVLRGVSDCGLKISQGCRTIGLAKGFAQAGLIAAGAIMAGLTIDMAESMLFDDNRFGSIPSLGLVTGILEARPKPSNGLEKVEFRLFAKAPFNSFTNSGPVSSMSDVKIVAALDFKVGASSPKLRGSWELRSGRAATEVGSNFGGLSLQVCSLEFAKIELAVRAGVVGSNSAGLHLKGSLGVEATLLRFIKLQYPLFPPQSSAAGQ